MKLVYSLEEPPDSFSKSIFLAGPTPRSSDVRSWRPDALKVLRAQSYDGTVFIPEGRNISSDTDYTSNDTYPVWEHRMLDMSDCILFWVPRDLQTLPGFTTNVEFGLYADSGKVVFGAPENTPATSYLKFVCKKLSIPYLNSLEETVAQAISSIGNGALRTGGERNIPFQLWRLRAFHTWYRAQKKAGNRLDGASVEWLSRVRNKPEAIFAFALRPNVFVASEGRNKINDQVVFRLDISVMLLYKKTDNVLDTRITLVREFRTASSTEDSFIWELSGGSSPVITDPFEVALEETREEVGLDLSSETERIVAHGSRQLTGTLSAYQAHLFSMELTDAELDWLEAQEGIAHGADLGNSTGERTYIQIRTLREVLNNQLVDWSNLGMILSVLTPQQGGEL